MILEHVLISVDPDRAKDYLEAFKEAQPLVISQPGCYSCQLLPKLATPGKFLLLIKWERKEDHTEGFRKSEAYQHWSRLLHPFYAEFPTVEYFEFPD